MQPLLKVLDSAYECGDFDQGQRYILVVKETHDFSRMPMLSQILPITPLYNGTKSGSEKNSSNILSTCNEENDKFRKRSRLFSLDSEAYNEPTTESPTKKIFYYQDKIYSFNSTTTEHPIINGF